MSLLAADCDPTRPALFDGASGERLTHAALRARVGDVAAGLRSSDARLVALVNAQDVATAIAWLGALEAGCAALWLEPAHGREGIARQLDLYRPDLALAHGLEASPAPGYVELRDARLGRVWRRGVRDERPIHPSLACLLLTSGSTGNPRVARLSRSAIESNAAAIVAALGLRATDVALLALPLAHAFGLSVLNSHLLAGGAVALAREGVLQAGFWRLAREAGTTCIPGVPLTFELLRRLRPERVLPPGVRLLTQAGGRLPLADVRFFRDLMRARDGELRVMYGQTEASARISAWPRDVPESALGSVGQALPGGSLRIDSGSGEILYRGPNVMLGYADARADLSRGAEIDELRTGDLGSLDADGFLFVEGRLRRIAKLAGRRFDLDDVERLIEGFPAAAIEDDGRLVIFVQGAARAALDEVATGLCARLALERGALDLRAIDTLPRTSSGKIAYAALPR